MKFKYPRGKSRNNIPKDRRKLLKNKKKLKNKLKKNNLSNKRKDSIKNAIIDIDKQLLTSHQNERNSEEMQAISNMKVNPKYFFTYAKKHIKTKSSIGPFKINDNLIAAPEEISEKLSEQYSSSFSDPDLNHSIGDTKDFFSSTEEANNILLTDISFTREAIIK